MDFLFLFSVCCCDYISPTPPSLNSKLKRNLMQTLSTNSNAILDFYYTFIYIFYMLFAMLNVETGEKVNFNLNVPHNFPPDSYSLTRSFCVMVFFFFFNISQTKSSKHDKANSQIRTPKSNSSSSSNISSKKMR